MNRYNDGPLGQRLAALQLPIPATLVPRVLNQVPTPSYRAGARRPLWATVALATCLIIVGLISASYFAPGFQQVLAESPLVGPALDSLLHDAGLDSVASRFTQAGSSATSSGYRVQLAAVYADSNETYLVIRVTPAVFAFPTNATLTDQFGRSFEYKGADTQSDGSALLRFDGIGWPDNVVGARLSLRVHSLERFGSSGAPLGPIVGDWKLSAVVDVGTTKPYPHQMPAAGRLGDSTVQFVQISASAATVRVEIKVSGPLATHLTDAVGQAIPNVSKPHEAFQVRLLAPDGSEVQALDGGASSGLGGEDVTQTWLRPARGNYRLVVSYEGVGQVDRQLSLDY
jgi:Domain of unknown function (DUF4179)